MTGMTPAPATTATIPTFANPTTIPQVTPSPQPKNIDTKVGAAKKRAAALSAHLKPLKKIRLTAAPATPANRSPSPNPFTFFSNTSGC